MNITSKPKSNNILDDDSWVFKVNFMPNFALGPPPSMMSFKLWNILHKLSLGISCQIFIHLHQFPWPLKVFKLNVDINDFQCEVHQSFEYNVGVLLHNTQGILNSNSWVYRLPRPFLHFTSSEQIIGVGSWHCHHLKTDKVILVHIFQNVLITWIWNEIITIWKRTIWGAWGRHL